MAPKHPLLITPDLKVGRTLPGRKPVHAQYLAGCNAATRACLAEGSAVLSQPEPRGFSQHYLDGWRCGLAMVRAVGVAFKPRPDHMPIPLVREVVP
jgi:hypothetical protein